MLSDAVLTISFVFSRIWQLFNSFYIPGTRVTPAAFAIFSLVVVFVLRILHHVFKTGDSDGKS